MNEMINMIINRRSVRRFLPEQLKDSDLNGIIEAGRFAPSGGNSQTSHILVIQNTEILNELRLLVEQEFCKMEIAEGMYQSIKNSIRASQKGGYHYHYDSPTLIVVANRKGYPNAMADSSCVLENMMLAATSLGVGSCWINQLHWLDETEVIRTKMISLGLLDNETICGALALGYPVTDSDRQEPLKRIGNNVTYLR